MKDFCMKFYTVLLTQNILFTTLYSVLTSRRLYGWSVYLISLAILLNGIYLFKLANIVSTKPRGRVGLKKKLFCR